MSKVELKLNGETFTGWQRVSITRSIEALSGRFELEVTDKEPFPIVKGGDIVLSLYDSPIITGYTDEISAEISSDTHSFSVSGRDKTADLVDGSAVVDSQEMLNVTLKDIIETVIDPFGITAIFEVTPATKFKKFAFQEETAFNAIERACKLRGVFANSDAEGNLIIQEYGVRRAATGLYIGQNVLSARSNFNTSERFSTYLVYGQQPGTDGVSEDGATGSFGEASDSSVSRYRPLIIVAEGAVDNEIAQQRAEWEAAVRAARGSTIEVVVQGWQQDNGDLWRENTLVRCQMAEAGVVGDMLIREVGYTLDNTTGEKTRLVLTRPDAYALQPDIEAEEAGFE